MEAKTTTSSPTEFYAGLILDQAPRVLGRMDRDPESPTAGCCDRLHWAWKFVDFPGARFQESLAVLSYLYAVPMEGSRFRGSARLLSWIESGLRFWSSIQYADGSFDEAYPFERSLAATAFSAFYVSEALGFLGDALPAKSREAAVSTLARAGDWLGRNDESHGFLSNHLAAAAGACLHVSRITGEERHERRARYFIERILRHQSDEGWYEEYGGADPGYQTHGTFYLARCLEMGGWDDLRDSLVRSTEFLGLFVHPDGSLGGEYASRNTQTYYPAAFEMMAGFDPSSAWIAGAMRPVVSGAAAAGIRGIDAQNLFPVLNNLVFAHRAVSAPVEGSPVEPREPSPEPGLLWFPEAGIARRRTESYDAYVGVTKGGVLKVYDRRAGRLAASDCGYVGRRNGKSVSTQQQNGAKIVVAEEGRIALAGGLYQVSRPRMSPLRLVAFRVFMLTFGRFAGFAHWLKRYLVKVLIYRKRELDARFARSIEFGPGSITVRDELGGGDMADVDGLRRVPVFSTIHMGSSRYFVEQEVEGPDWNGESVAPGDFPIVRTIRLDGEDD